MNKNMKKGLFVVPFLLLGMGAVTQTISPQVLSVQQVAAEENGWKLLETKDGVSCYTKIAPLGSGNGVHMRFVNESAGTVSISWTVQDGGMAVKGTVVLAKGMSAEPGNQPSDAPSLSVRIATDAPAVSFNVTK